MGCSQQMSPSKTRSVLSKGVGVMPLMAKPGTKNLVTDSMKPTSATTVGLWSRTWICTSDEAKTGHRSCFCQRRDTCNFML